MLEIPSVVPAGLPAAQISPFPEFLHVPALPRDHWHQLPSLSPRVLIGYTFDLLRLADRVNRAELSLPTLDHAIFALTDCGSRTVSELSRTVLWQSFGVPAYELIIAPGCSLLAAECEAHDGWHLQEGVDAHLIDDELVCDLPPLRRLHTGMSGLILTAPCPCSRPTPRLKDLLPHHPRPNARRLAAIA